MHKTGGSHPEGSPEVDGQVKPSDDISVAVDETRAFTTSVSTGKAIAKVDIGDGAQHTASSPSSPAEVKHHDPDEYQHAKKKLRRAVLECYR